MPLAFYQHIVDSVWITPQNIVLTKYAVPTGNLDTATSHDVLGLIKYAAKEFQQTVILITHDNDIAQMADRIVRIEDGKLVKGSGDRAEE